MAAHINAKLLRGDVVLNSNFQTANPDLMATILGQMTGAGVNIAQFTAGGVGDFIDEQGVHTFGDSLPSEGNVPPATPPPVNAPNVRKRGGVINTAVLEQLKASRGRPTVQPGSVAQPRGR